MATRKKSAGPGPLKKFLAVLFALAALALLAGLFWLFWNISFLPLWFTIVLRATCGVFAIGVIWLLALYLAS